MSNLQRQLQVQNQRSSTPARPVELVLNQEYIESLIESVKSAQREIRLTAYDWRIYENSPTLNVQRLNQALFEARGRGVTVRAIVDSQLDHLIKICDNMEILSLSADRTMHAKAFCIDDSALFLGSHNITKSANNRNYEISAKITEFEPVAQFIKYFDTLWRHSGGS